MMQRHIHEYGTTIEQMAWISVKSHKNGAMNPIAHYRNMGEVTVQDVLNSRMVVTPFTIYMIAPTSEGAGAILIGSEEAIKKYSVRKPIEIAGCVQSSMIYEWDELLYPPSLLRITAKQVYEQAGIGPEDVDIAQIQDGMPVGEIEGLEEMGFCEMGDGGKLAEKGITWIDGTFPVNTDGGYMTRGNCIGATGAAAMAEVVYQLRGEAGPRQVTNIDPKVGLAHNMGAGIQTSIAILKK
ncbi:MAG: thiolase family protein [Planctomycetes bacterium]|nr:thiolase family protein [Planctomycetota bacterium]